MLPTIEWKGDCVVMIDQRKLPSAEVYVTHLKPGEIELTMQEIEDCAGQYRPRMLQNNQVFEF
mgnify:CR=1 FL=1